MVIIYNGALASVDTTLQHITKFENLIHLGVTYYNHPYVVEESAVMYMLGVSIRDVGAEYEEYVEEREGEKVVLGMYYIGNIKAL